MQNGFGIVEEPAGALLFFSDGLRSTCFSPGYVNIQQFASVPLPFLFRFHQPIADDNSRWSNPSPGPFWGSYTLGSPGLPVADTISDSFFMTVEGTIALYTWPEQFWEEQPVTVCDS